MKVTEKGKRKSLSTKTFLLLSIFLTAGTAYFAWFWIITQPVWIYDDVPATTFTDVPLRNRQILEVVKVQGRTLAPEYRKVVCTDFVIAVISEFVALNRDEKKAINIVTNQNIVDLVAAESPVLRGVDLSLSLYNKGVSVSAPLARPGDFVQFWNLFNGKAYGHCGIVADVEPGRSITVCSSHPLTNGFGVQKFLWPQRAYFVRLR